MTRHTYTTCLAFGDDGEADYVELDATVSYNVIWGSPADPWGDDPGSGDEIDDLRVEAIDGRPVVAGDRITCEAIITLLNAKHEADLICAAQETEADDHAYEMDRRAEDRAELRREEAKASSKGPADD